MVIDELMGRAYNMTRPAALVIANYQTPAGAPCFWCGAETDIHTWDCVFYAANRVITLTNEDGSPNHP